MRSCPSLTKDWHFDQRMRGGIGTRCKPTAARNFFATRLNHRMSFSWIDVDSASKLTVEQFTTAQLSNVFGVGSRDKGFTPGIHPCPISSHPCCGASEMCFPRWCLTPKRSSNGCWHKESRVHRGSPRQLHGLGVCSSCTIFCRRHISPLRKQWPKVYKNSQISHTVS